MKFIKININNTNMMTTNKTTNKITNLFINYPKDYEI